MAYRATISDGTILTECVDHVSFNVVTSNDSNSRNTNVRNSMIITGKIDLDEGTASLYKWALLPATNADCYKEITVEQYHKNLLVRKVCFSKAFVVDYSENYSNHAGGGTFTLHVRQLLGKDIFVDTQEAPMVVTEETTEVAEEIEEAVAVRQETPNIIPVTKSSMSFTDRVAKQKEMQDNSKGRKLNLEDFTDQILKTKPMNSPAPEKWLGKKGGSIFIDDNGTWTYMNKEGQSVSYPNGYPDFSEYTHSTVQPVEIEVARPKNPQADFKEANEKAGLSKDSDPPVPAINKPPDGYTWHHHQDGKTMILVDEDVHREFRHIGGQSTINGKNGTGE